MTRKHSNSIWLSPGCSDKWTRDYRWRKGINATAERFAQAAECKRQRRRARAEMSLFCAMLLGVASAFALAVYFNSVLVLVGGIVVTSGGCMAFGSWLDKRL